MATPHVLDTSLFLPLAPERIFPFFADAGNLEAITPPWLNFSIVTERPIDLHEDSIIDYRLRLRGVPLVWRTRIASYDPPRMFVDEQVKGPYRLWRHTHLFQPVGPIGGRPPGTLVRDRVEYLLPRLPPGVSQLVHLLLVRPDLERIFSYRQRRIREILLGPPVH